jgi:pSer/pThr/pTyr-binding forkhead associated (FHA) protein
MLADETVNLSVVPTSNAVTDSSLPLVRIVEDTVTLLMHPSTLPIKLRDGEEIILGRTHVTNAGRALVDLSKYNGTAYGVSRVHALLRHKDSQWWVEDLGSSNGTWLNGERLAPFTAYRLSNNSQLILANMEIGIVLPEVYTQRSLAA